MDSGIVSIMHPTDFSDLSINAFVHALRISLAVRCKLYIVHVAEQDDDKDAGRDDEQYPAESRSPDRGPPRGADAVERSALAAADEARLWGRRGGPGVSPRKLRHRVRPQGGRL